MTDNTGPITDLSHAAAELRAHDRDRYYAALFAPEATRQHLFALYAFALEIGRIRELARDPLPGEVRLQWWRDLIAGEAHGGEGGHPLAVALLEAIRVSRLPTTALTDMIEARTLDLYDDPLPGWNELEGYCGETASALIRLACLVLAGGQDPGAAAEAGHTGLAIALTGLLRSLPWHAAQGRVMLPEELLAAHGVARADILAGRDSAGLRSALAEVRRRARGHRAAALANAGALRPEIMPAFLPLALVEGYLRRMERRDYDPFRSRIERADWLKLATMWVATRRGF